MRQTFQALSTLPLPAELPGTATPPPATQPVVIPIAESPGAFAGLQTATPGTPGGARRSGPTPDGGWPVHIYFSQSGDTRSALAARFGVDPGMVTSPEGPLPAGWLPPGLAVLIPDLFGPAPYPSALLPDSEVIYGPSTAGFSTASYVEQAGGHLAAYLEVVDVRQLTGAEIVERVALEASINPRLLLAFLEFRSGWVHGQPRSPLFAAYPIGFYVDGYAGLYQELTLAANHLNIGYYDWRVGTLERLRFEDRSTVRPAPALNPGTVALQNLFAKFYDQPAWLAALHGPDGFLALHARMFGDPWQRAAGVEPLLLPGQAQPELELPFASGERWLFTGGPHRVLTRGSPLGALDFAPATGEARCAVSRAWVRASAPGVVTRSEGATVALDLDGDGHEGTGLVVYYYHIAERGRVPAGSLVALDDPLGHPSCEGGRTTGTHVHMARKYNGEWLAADGPRPMVLSGWRAYAGDRLYAGYLVKGNRTLEASPGGSGASEIVR